MSKKKAPLDRFSYLTWDNIESWAGGKIVSRAGWQNYWNSEGYTPDYSVIRQELMTLLKAGHNDEVLTLRRELVTTGIRQVEESDDEGETEREIADCMPVIVAALDRSSLDAADKLTWALDALLEDQFEPGTSSFS